MGDESRRSKTTRSPERTLPESASMRATPVCTRRLHGPHILEKQAPIDEGELETVL